MRALPPAALVDLRKILFHVGLALGGRGGGRIAGRGGARVSAELPARPGDLPARHPAHGIACEGRCGHRGPGTGASPLGATSPPAATVFGGGILDPTPGDEALPFFHAVVLDSDSDSGLEVDELTAAGTNGAAGRPSGPQGP